ncbi:MAG TPA: Rrf2 family transcriptional regulator [Saprospiraceae bacterium]|nr:Rrf2 family transcriptional regulator [Saprospiraceae bacterium]
MFSRSTEYALRAIIYLAQKSSKEHKIGITQLAEAIDSPKSFTAKILQKLTKDNVLISSATGPNGGFYLSDEAKKKSLLYVLELLDDEIVISGCVLGLRECSETNPCPMHAQYKHIKPQLLHMLSHKTIGELAGEMKDTRIVIRNVDTMSRKGRRTEERKGESQKGRRAVGRKGNKT